MDKSTAILIAFALFQISFLAGTDGLALNEEVRQGFGDINLGPSDYKCPSHGALPHPQYCNLYYTCYENTQTYLYQCRDNLLFDLVYSGCNYPEMTDCGDRIRNSTEIIDSTTKVPTTRPSTPDFTCPSQEDHFYPHADCSKFYRCVDGFPYVYTCPSGLFFNPATDECDWPANVPQCH